MNTSNHYSRWMIRGRRANTPSVRQRPQNRSLRATLSRRPIDNRADRNDATRAIRRLKLNFGAPWMIVKPMAAAKTAGMLIKNEMRNASSAERPMRRSDDVVTPERETPGRAENPWIKPRSSPSFIFKISAVREPLLRATLSTIPVEMRATPVSPSSASP